MAVLLTTMGFTASLALAPLRDYPDINKVHLFYGTPMKDGTKTALKDARATAKTLGVILTEHKVTGAFDYSATLKALATTYSKITDSKIILNGSAGTRPMIMATTIFAFTNDVPLLYYDEYETKQGKEIPLRAFRNLRHLGESQLAILRTVQMKPADMGSLAATIGLAPSTLSVHVHHLVESGIVRIERQGKRRIVTAVDEVMAIGLTT
jgi:DNA-binding transcriptional ArsR family regulator